MEKTKAKETIVHHTLQQIVIICAILAISLIILPTMTQKSYAAVIDSGTCGDNVTWTLTGTTSDMVLTISGTGAMEPVYEYSEWVEGTYVCRWKNYTDRIKSIVIEEGVTGICVYAFFGCSSLTSINIPDSVASIGASAFSGCGSLTSIIIPDSVTSIGTYAFSSCGSLTSIVIPEGVTNIGAGTFSECSSLTSVTIPESVTNIEGSATSGGYTYRNSAFSNCTNLREVHYNGSKESWRNVTIGNNNTSLSSARMYYAQDISYLNDYALYVTLSNNSYTYDGQAKCPDIVINNYHFEEGVDYEVTYKNNINAGTATATATGIGRCTGDVSIDYQIEKLSLDSQTLTFSKNTYVYDGKEKKPKVSIGKLIEGKDFEVVYYDNINAGDSWVSAEGIGSCTGAASGSFTIEPASIKNYTASLSPTRCIYDGNEKYPDVTVGSLTEGEDYEVNYYDNVDVGTGRVEINGIGNYTGTITKAFTIEKLTLDNYKDFADKYISIRTPDDLNSVRDNINACYRLENDIDLTGATSKGGDYYNGGEGWIPISDFNGVFDGNGHTIKGLKISDYNDITALFCQNHGIIKDLTVDGTVNTILAEESHVAGVVGRNYGIIDSCINKCNVSATGRYVNCVGGISSTNDGEISNCSNYGAVSISGVGTSIFGSLYGPTVYAGGLVGRNWGSADGKNYGKINATTSNSSGYAGGITGYNEDDSTISNSYNEGDVTIVTTGNKTSFGSYAGGVSGYSKCSITTSENHGAILASGINSYSLAGGVCAATDGSNFDKCKNYGVITAYSDHNTVIGTNAGGIVGEITDGYNYKIYGCINAAKVNSLSPGSSAAGGITGTALCTIEYCANTGQIVAKGGGSYLVVSGGIAGEISENGSIKRSANGGTIFGSGDSGNIGRTGGIAGLAEENTIISQCYGKAPILGFDIAGGIAGSTKGSIEECYSLSSFDTTESPFFGGIVGLCGSTSIVKNVYSNISYTGDNANGALLIGENNGTATGSLIAGNYNNLETVLTGTKVGKILCTRGMKNKSTFGNFDFANVWEMGTGNYKLPILKKSIGGQNGLKVNESCIYGEWKVTKEPTVDEKGKKERTCRFCHGTEVQTLEKLPSSNPSDSGQKGPEQSTKPDSRASQTGSDGTALGKGASAEAAEAAILAMKNDKDPAGSKFAQLQAKSVKQTKTSVTVTWKKVKGAKKYVVYGNKCGKKDRMQKQIKTGKTTITFKKVKGNNGKKAKVKKGTYYKFLIVALDKNNNVVSSSKMIHVATKGGKVGNDKKVTTKAKKNKVTIKKGKSFKLAAKAVPVSKKLKVKRHRAITYETSNKKIATVNKKGVIKAKKKGKCYIYAYAQNGVAVKIKVTIK